jgi:hypothetical protein
MDHLESPVSRSPLLRPGRVAALLVVAGLVAGTLFAPNNPLRAFLRPVISPAEPPMVADLFFTAALLVLLVDRLRAGLAVASGLGIGGAVGAPGLDLRRIKELLLARRGGDDTPSFGSSDPYSDPLGSDSDDDFEPPAPPREGAPAASEIEEDPWR